MKKLYSILLVLFILPSVFIFSSCEEKTKYSILNFYTTYLAISEESKLLTKIDMPAQYSSTNRQIVGFVYSDELQQKIQDITSYSYIESLYNAMLNDALGPVYLYGNSLHTAENLSNKDINYLFKNLEQLKNDYVEISSRLLDLENSLNNATALTNLSKLYMYYENAIATALKISSKISTIFYTNIIENSNINYTKMQDKDINLTELAIHTLNKLAYYKMIYLDIYFHTEVVGKNLSQQLLTGNLTASYLPYEQTKNMIYPTSQPRADIDINRTQLCSLARTLYGIQKVFNREYDVYLEARQKVSYNSINEKSSAIELGYKQIVDSFIGENGIVYHSYRTVKEILSLSY